MENYKAHYVYLHITNTTSVPFYIGIGTKQHGDSLNLKLRYARAYSKSKRNAFWTRIVEKYGYKVIILLESDNYEYIKEQEINFVKVYGRRDKKEGTLTNLTDGGDGMLGHSFSKKSKKKMSESAKMNFLNGKGIWSDKDKYKKHSIRMLGNQYAKGSKLSKKALKKLREARIEKGNQRVLQYSLDNILLKEWYTTVEAANFYKISYKAIWNAIKRKSKSVGYYWKYKE